AKYPTDNPGPRRDTGNLSCTVITRTYPKSGIVGNLPKMAIEILEVTTVTAPEYLLRLFHQGCTGRHRLRHHGIDFAFRRNIVVDRKAGKPAALCCYLRIIRQCFAPKQPEPGSIQGEKRHFRGRIHARKAHTLSIKINRRGQISNTEGDHANSWFHGLIYLLRICPDSLSDIKSARFPKGTPD